MDLLDVSESEPTARPSPPSDLSDPAAALDANALWARIEAWCAWRWGERSVTWIIQGPGQFLPPLQPATVDTVEVWNDGVWTETTLAAAPLGLEVPDGVYRITATVGTADDPPADVLEAYRRLAEYLADDSHVGRVPTSASRSASGVSINVERPAAWQAKALHYSGAADLLRRWR